MKTAWIGGGSGFIGHHMARRLRSEGYWVMCVDIKSYEYGDTDFCNQFVLGDLRDINTVFDTLTSNSFDEVYSFACQMGGCQYVFTGENDADILHDSALINLNILNSLNKVGFNGKIFYSSSACIYPQGLQNNNQNVSLKESDAYPADPDSCYGLEKLFSERLYMAYARNYGLDVRIARFHNIYGTEGTYKGGREKAPASISRKVIECKENETINYPNNKGFAEGGYVGKVGSVEIWGDGEQTRSFLYIDDCIDAVRLLMESEFKEPINIGSEEMVSINQLWDLAIECSGKQITKVHTEMPKGLQGVRGRNSDNTLIRQVLNWEPKYSLKEGLTKTFNWIKNEIAK